MADNIFHLSKLRCVPNKISALQPSQYYGPAEGYTFWRVFADDEMLTNSAQPFTAYDPIIELFGNPEVPIWGDGGGYISVRQISQYVIWCKPLEETVEYFLIKPGLPDERFIIFDRDSYIETLYSLQSTLTSSEVNKGIAKHFSHNLSYPPLTNPENALPRLSAAELDWLLRPHIPADNLPLYRSPENPDDARGVQLFQRIKAVLASTHDNIVATEPPATWLEIRIGLDLPEFVECVWKVGKTPQGYAILFVSNPHFPLWLSSSGITQALSAERLSI